MPTGRLRLRPRARPPTRPDGGARRVRAGTRLGLGLRLDADGRAAARRSQTTTPSTMTISEREQPDAPVGEEGRRQERVLGHRLPERRRG